MKWEEVEIKKADEVPLVDEVTLLAHERETGYKAIVNRQSMDTICVVPDTHQIVQHNHVLAEALKLKNYVPRKMELTKNGKMLMIELTEQQPKKIELMPKDFIEVGVRVFNDYSKNAGLSVQAFGTRLACMNGVVAPKYGQRVPIQAFGTAEFNKEMELRINDAFECWKDEKINKIFERAAKTTISVKDILEDHSFLPKKYMEEVIKQLKDKETLYDIWNAYTQVITHKMAPNIKDIGTINLQKRANKILTIEVEA